MHLFKVASLRQVPDADLAQCSLGLVASHCPPHDGSLGICLQQPGLAGTDGGQCCWHGNQTCQTGVKRLATVLELQAYFTYCSSILMYTFWHTVFLRRKVHGQVLELLAYLTYCSPAISPRLWSLWPQLAACLNDWAVDFFENVLVVLDNFISRGTDTFLACKQPDYLASVNQVGLFVSRQ